MRVTNRLLAAAAVLGLVALMVSDAQAFGRHRRGGGCGGGCYSSCSTGCSSGCASGGCSACTSAPAYTSTSSCGCDSGGMAYNSGGSSQGGYSQSYANRPSQDYSNSRQASRPPAPTDDSSSRDSGSSSRSGGDTSIMSRGNPPPVPEPQ